MNRKKKEAGIAILISDKNFKTRATKETQKDTAQYSREETINKT